MTNRNNFQRRRNGTSFAKAILMDEILCIIKHRLAAILSIQFLIFFVSLFFACSGCGGANSNRGNENIAFNGNTQDNNVSLYEPAPSSEEILILTKQLLMESNDRLDSATRQQIDEYSTISTQASSKSSSAPLAVADAFSAYRACALQSLLKHNNNVALNCLLRASNEQNNNVETLANIGYVLNKEGKYTEAKKYLLYAQQFAPENTSILNNLAYAYQGRRTPSQMTMFDCVKNISYLLDSLQNTPMNLPQHLAVAREFSLCGMNLNAMYHLQNLMLGPHGEIFRSLMKYNWDSTLVNVERTYRDRLSGDEITGAYFGSLTESNKTIGDALSQTISRLLKKSILDNQ